MSGMLRDGTVTGVQTCALPILRGGTGGDAATALNYINLLRKRAYGNASGIIDASQLTTDFILDERGRELYYEAQRRTDLIRYGKFTGSRSEERRVGNEWNVTRWNCDWSSDVCSSDLARRYRRRCCYCT